MLKYVDYDIVFQEIPDEVTLAIYISNCPNRCVGCHSAFLRNNIGKVLNENELDHLIYRYGDSVTCICFMGGDSDVFEVCKLALHISQAYGNKYSVAWYSGKSDIPGYVDIGLFKYVKLGPYVECLGGLRSRSTNQRLYKLNSEGDFEDITDAFWE